MKNLTAKKWVSPKTGEVRIYINGAANYDVKVYVCDGGLSGNYSDDFAEVKIWSDRMIFRLEKDVIIDRIGQNLGMKFSEILAKAE